MVISTGPKGEGGRRENGGGGGGRAERRKVDETSGVATDHG